MAGQDLGTDVGNVAIEAGIKIYEGIVQTILLLLEKIWEAWKDSPERKLKKEQYRELREINNWLKEIRKMEGIEGEIAWGKLRVLSRTTDTPIVLRGIRFESEAEMKRFAELAKRNHIPWAGIKDPNVGFDNQITHIHFLQSDAGRMDELLEILSDERWIRSIDKRIQQIKEKGKLSEQDLVNIENLEKLKQKIRDKYTDRYNEKSYEDEIDKATNPDREQEDMPDHDNEENEKGNDQENDKESDQENEKGNDQENDKESDQENEKGNDQENDKESDQENDKESDQENNRESGPKNNKENEEENNRKNDQENYEIFEDTDKESTLASALDMYTGRIFDEGQSNVIVDSSEPERFIICNSQRDAFHGRDYTRTEYEVHNPQGETYRFSDKRFEGRPDNYWRDIKKDILTAGGFSARATLLKFNSVQDFEKWKARAIRENAAEKIVRDLTANYGQQIDMNRSEIKRLGFEIREDGELYHSDRNMSARVLIRDEKLLSSDGNDLRLQMLNIVKAMNLHEQIGMFEELQEVEQQLSMAKAGQILADTPQNREQMDRTVASLEQKKGDLVEKVTWMDEKRAGYNGIESSIREKEQQRDRANENSQKDRNGRDESRSSDSIAAVLDQEDDRLFTMEEYEVRIVREKQNSGNTGENRMEKDAAKGKAPKAQGIDRAE